MRSLNGEALTTDLFERVLTKLEIARKPTLDVAGLNLVYAAYSSHVPNDNIQKRIWLVGDRARPLTDGDPAKFFVDWLEHGTGSTCFASNDALCALLGTIGFNARRFSGSVLMEGLEHDGNHGTVIVRIDNIDYLADAQLASFAPLPLIPGQYASTGNGIHDISAKPSAEGFDIYWYPGANRERPMIMRPDLARGAVDHNYFMTQYALSASKDRRRSPFNEALFIGRHFRESILIINRNNRIFVSSNNVVVRSEITLEERTKILIEEFGISESAANSIPQDENDGL